MLLLSFAYMKQPEMFRLLALKLKLLHVAPALTTNSSEDELSFVRSERRECSLDHVASFIGDFALLVLCNLVTFENKLVLLAAEWADSLKDDCVCCV